MTTHGAHQAQNGQNTAESSAANPTEAPLDTAAATEKFRSQARARQKDALAAALANDAKTLRKVLRILEEMDETALDLHDEGGRTPLMILAGNGNADGVKALDGWCDPDARDTFGRTALAWAVLAQNLSCAKWLAARTRLDGVDNEGHTILHLAAGEKNPKILRWALSLSGVDANAQDETGQTALHLAIGHEDAAQECALALIGKCDASAQDSDGNTALACAALYDGAPRAFEALLPLSDVNHKNKAGANTLMIAANVGNLDFVERLIAWPGVRLWDTDRKGRTAIDWALLEDREDRSEGEIACAQALAKIVPLDIAEGVIARVGAETLPELHARVEAEKLRTVVASAVSTQKPRDEMAVEPAQQQTSAGQLKKRAAGRL